jgi:hypothetical protein
MIAASLDRALEDKRLSPLKVQVYALLHRELVYHEFRPVKLFPLALRAHATRGAVSHALSVLVRCGYLARGPDSGPAGRIIRTYLLLMSAECIPTATVQQP